jgi:hypothetical protein
MKVRLTILGAVSAAMLAFVGTAGATDVYSVRPATDVMAVHVASSSWTGLHRSSSTWNSFRLLGEKWGNGLRI